MHVTFVKQGFLSRLPNLLQELKRDKTIISPLPSDEEDTSDEEQNFLQEYEEREEGEESTPSLVKENQ